MPRKRQGTIEEQQKRDRCNKIRAMLRRAWSKDPRRFDCLKENRRKYNGPNKRQRYEYQCNICNKWFKQDQVQIDHIIPCGGFELTPESLGGFVLRMFEGELQKVCSNCHSKKSKEENATLREARSNRALYPREESSYRNMISRCYNENATGYKYYGGRGIKVCKKWRESFLNFLDDMGPRPEGTTLDRIDFDKDYNKKNCRWTTYIEQGRNTSGNNIVVYKDEALCIQEWAERLNIKPNTLTYRLLRGWPIGEALGLEPRTKSVYDGRLNSDQIIFLVNSINNGMSQVECGKILDLDCSQVNRLYHRFKDNLHLFDEE